MQSAEALFDQGKYADAEVEYRAIVGMKTRVLGPKRRETLKSRSNLATTLYAQGKYAEAELENYGVFDLQVPLLGPDDPDVTQTCYNLALCLKAEGKKPKLALDFARLASSHWILTLGFDHPDTQKAMKLAKELEQAQ